VSFVRLLTDHLHRIELPVGITSAMRIQGVPIRFSTADGRAALDENMTWVGVNVALGGR